MPLELTPKGTSRGNMLYARAMADKERKEMRAQEETRARCQQEIKGCTFKPDTAQSERSYNRAHDGVAPAPRGFYETRQRLRAANEVMNQKRQQREDRLCKLAPVGKVNLNASSGTQASSLT